MYEPNVKCNVKDKIRKVLGDSLGPHSDSQKIRDIMKLAAEFQVAVTRYLHTAPQNAEVANDSSEDTAVRNFACDAIEIDFDECVDKFFLLRSSVNSLVKGEDSAYEKRMKKQNQNPF